MDAPRRISELVPEPPNKTVLTARDYRDEYFALWRDDETAADCDAEPGQRWWTSTDPDVAVDWPTATVYAAAIYEVSPAPLAVTPDAPAPEDRTEQVPLFGAWLATKGRTR